MIKTPCPYPSSSISREDRGGALSYFSPSPLPSPVKGEENRGVHRGNAFLLPPHFGGG